MPVLQQLKVKNQKNMSNNEKKSLTPGSNSPKINPDAYWNLIKKKAREQRYGTLIVEFSVHDGQIATAELIGSREKLWPY